MAAAHDFGMEAVEGMVTDLLQQKSARTHVLKPKGKVWMGHITDYVYFIY